MFGLLLCPSSRSSTSQHFDKKTLTHADSEAKALQDHASQEILFLRGPKILLVEMTTPRTDHTATALPDGRVLIVGGINERGPLASAELFHSHRKKFIETGHLATARYGHTAALLPDGRVLIAGGRNDDGLLDSTEIFDPATHSFLRGPLLNRARAGHSATVLADGRILIVGGDAEGSAEIFDPMTQSFALVEARLRTPRAFHAAVQLQSGKVLIAGGLAPDGTAMRSAELFDPETMEFSPTGNPMHSARVRPTLRVLPDGKVQVIGGDPEPSMEMFNPEGEYFTAHASLSPGSLSLPEVLQIQMGAALFDKLATPDAKWQRVLSRNLVELLDRSDHTWTEMLRSNHTLVAGGVNSRGRVLSSAFLLTTSQPTVTTDKTDYSPGETVTIYGSGFAPGPITLTVTRPDGQVDSIPNVQAESDGKFTATYQLDGIEGTYTVRATDSLGRTAQTTFTDASSRITQIGFNPVNQPASFTVGVPNGTSTPLRVQAQNSEGTGETVTGSGQSITIQVTSSSATGRFDTSPSGSFTATSLTLQITTGFQNTPDFFYRDTTAGTVTLTATVTARTSQVSNLQIGSTATLTKTVNKANTTTTVASNLNPSCQGQPVTFTATVAHATGGAGTPTGTVTFKDGSATLGTGTLGSGPPFTATFTTSSLLAGSHSITAVYTGDSNFNGSTSSAITQNVTATPTCSISGPDLVCPHSSGHTYTATSSLSGSSFSWAISGNGTIVGSTTGSSVTVNAGAAGSFTLTVTVSENGCSSTCTKTVTVGDTTPPTITCPANVTVQCGVNVPPANFANGTASDNCGTPTVVHVGDVSSDTCPRIITRTYKATDASGNAQTCTQTITVNDTIPPELSGCPTNASFQCISEVPAPATVTATDNCDGPPSVTFTETQSNPGSSCNNTITRTWKATDACGNMQTCAQTITVNDTTAPTITTCAAAQSASANGSCQAPVPNFTSGVAATDNCAGSLMTTQNPTAGTMVGLGTHTITVTVQDACANSSTCTTAFTVTDNTPPTIAITTPAHGATYILGQAVAAAYSCSDNCSVATCVGTVANGANIDTSTLGAKSFTVTATDGSGNSDSKTHSYTVSPIPTTTTAAVSPTNVQYSDRVTFSATVTPTCAPCASVGGALTGTVEFRLINGSTNVVVASGVPINGSGVASTTVPILNAGPGTYTVHAIFTSTNPNYAGSMSSGPMLTITREDARATYTGTTFAFTSSSTGSTAVIALSATVRDITAVTGDPAYDPDPGDIRNATVKFVNRDASNGVLCTAPVGLVNSSDTKTGVATCNWTANIGNANSVSYTIGIIVEGYYTRNSSDDNVVVTVSKPLSNFITGGGYLIMQSSAGQYAGNPGSKSNFGFNVKYNKGGTNLQGNASIIIRKDGRVYQIKSNAINSLAVNPSTGTAEFHAKANLQDITDPNNPISIDGNATLILKMTDRGEPGSSDTIGITLLNKQGGLYFSSNWNGTRTVEQPLNGGNLVVR